MAIKKTKKKVSKINAVSPHKINNGELPICETPIVEALLDSINPTLIEIKLPEPMSEQELKEYKIRAEQEAARQEQLKRCP